MADDSHDAGRAEAEKLLDALRTRFGALHKRIKVLKAANGGRSPALLTRICKDMIQLKHVASSLDDRFSSKGPFRSEVTHLKKVAAHLARDLNTALQPGSAGLSGQPGVATGTAVKTETATSQLVDDVDRIARMLVRIKPGLEIAGQVALLVDIGVHIVRKRRKPRPS